MAIDIGYVSAVGAGAVSFLSPCVLPLVPPYLCYMAGVSVEDFRADGDVAARTGARTALLTSSLAFVLGFTHRLRRARRRRLDDRPLPARLAGAAGDGGRRPHHPDGAEFPRRDPHPASCRARRASRAQGKPASAVAAYVMGLAFAFGWTPCIGPVLGPILTLAGGRETVGEGALLLAAYSLGLGIPFLIAALFSGAFMRFLQQVPGASRPRREGDRRRCW